MNSYLIPDWRFLSPEEKKEDYQLLEVGEFKDVILTHNERHEVKSNLPKRFSVSHAFILG